MSDIPINTVLEMFDNNKSPYEIAEALNTYPNKIRRLLKKLGRQTRNHSEAQSIVLASGKTAHPTKGTKRSESTKRAIGNKVFEYWKQMPKEKKQAWIESCKEKWKAMPESKKREIRESAGEGIRRAAKEGSNLEKFLLFYLTTNGIDVTFHKKGLLNENLEVDLFLPSCKIAIEIDGPSHFFPIWGEDKLAAVISADNHKSGLLISNGFAMIRIKYLVKKLSNKRKEELGTKILEVINRIKDEFPSIEHRFIEIEVS